MVSIPLKINPFFDSFVVGDLIAVFYVSEVSSKVRIIGLCTSKTPASGSFEVFTKGEALYKFSTGSPNLIRIYNLKSRRTHV